ncbi:MAG: sulfatase [Sedimentisphaerales bacterium]|nr:sulfatase [Sedimentisphaerales bacterium]
MKNLNRRDFLSLATGGSLATVLTLTGCNRNLAKHRTAEKNQPNIIFLLTDDHRADAMGCAGNRIIQTPNMDDLAVNGVRFTNAFVTTSICASSRASIFTGQWTRQHSIKDFATHFSEEALAQTYPMLLSRAGYKIGFIGKYGVGQKKDLPTDKYDYWKGFPGQGRYENEDENGNYKHLTRIMGEQAIEFLNGCTENQPFCLSVSFKAPHVQDTDPRQFIYDRAYSELYKDVTIPEPETAHRRYFDALPEFVRNSEARIRWEMRFSDNEKFQESVRSYYRLITGVDIVIGKIREQLKRLSLDGNTIIILTGDNGFFLGEYGLAGKWFPHELSIRVPLLVYDPRAEKRHRGLTIDKMTLNVDIAPTILELAHLDIPEQMQGRSLVPLLKGKKPQWRNDFFYEHPFEHKTIAKSEALRTERFKYANYIDYGYEELYDLVNDPDETINLAKDEKYKTTLTTLRNRCNELAKKVEGK